MALYFNGSAKLVNLNNKIYQVNLAKAFVELNDIELLSSDGYVLKDSNDLYLIAPVNSGDIIEKPTLSLDGYILKDKRGLYLSNKEVD